MILQRWFNTDQPDGTKDFDDVCVSVNGLRSQDYYTNGEWADVLCSVESQFLCEKEE